MCSNIKNIIILIQKESLTCKINATIYEEFTNSISHIKCKKKLESESSNLKLLAKFLRINHYKILDISEFPKMKFVKLINSDNIEEKKV